MYMYRYIIQVHVTTNYTGSKPLQMYHETPQLNVGSSMIGLSFWWVGPGLVEQYVMQTPHVRVLQHLVS